MKTGKAVEAGRPLPSRVIIELDNGRRFATAWGTRAHDPETLPLGHLFTGRLVARVVGTESHIHSREIKRVFEEIMRNPEGEGYRRIALVRRAPDKTPKGRKLLVGAAKFADRLEGMTLARVDQIIDAPTASWPGWNGAMVYSDGDFQVVVGQQWSDTDCIMSVSRDDPNKKDESTERALPQDRRRASGHKADRRRPVPTSVSDFLDRVKEYGFEVDDSRRHYSITHPKRPGASTPVPRSPSDHRWANNMVTQIKQVFDIDVRKPLD